MLCFLPWASATEPIKAGSFEVVPTEVALDPERVPLELHAAVAAILEAYDKRRPVDQRRVPLLHRNDLELTSDLASGQITEYFEFRTRLAFAVMSARRFFSHRYANSDNARLVIQGFTPERAGGAVLEHRRRDGYTRMFVPRGNLSIPRPHHVSGWCELPQDLDLRLLHALEAAADQGRPSWPRLSEAIRLFVGANTDGPGIDMHSELIDVISAFNRVAEAWKEADTVDGFLRILPPPDEVHPRPDGPKVSDPRIDAALGKGESIRRVWLEDAYRLRSQFGHGRIVPSRYRSVWSEREHLLLSAVIFPLYVKAVLEQEGLYALTEEDQAINSAFEALATLSPFVERKETNEDKVEDVDDPSWSTIIAQAQMYRRLATWERQQNATESDDEPGSPLTG